MSRRRLFAAAALLAATLATLPGRGAEPPPPSTAEGVLSFAEALLEGGDSFRAATEFLRFLHHFPEDPAVPKALRGLGDAYARAGRWDDAAETFGRLFQTTRSEEDRRFLGAALYRGGRYGETADLLLSPGANEAARTLGTLALIRMGAPTELPRNARRDMAEAFSQLPRKSPTTAGGLSAVLPGAGQLYADRPRDALLSFVLNGGFLWATYEAARRDQWALAGILGFFEVGWYAGNIVSAANAAHKWNRREEGRFYQRWEGGALPSWSLSAAPGALGLVAEWRW